MSATSDDLDNTGPQPDEPPRRPIVDESVVDKLPEGDAGGLPEDFRDDVVHSRRIDWTRAAETYLRCFFLVAIVGTLGFLAWRPSQLRLSILLSLASPTRGESLDWRPEEEPAEPLPPRISVRQPAEWRLPAQHGSGSGLRRPGAKDPVLSGTRAPAMAWGRVTLNPWQWQNDVRRPQPGDREPPPPPQKPASSFKVGNLAAWPRPPSPAPAGSTPPAAPNAPAQSAQTTAVPQTAAALDAAMAGPFLAGLPSAPPELPPLPSGNGVAETIPSAPSSQEIAPIAANGNDSDNGNGNGNGIVTNTERAGVSAPVATPAPEPIDWVNTEITGAIPDAYLTIYPKLRFVGLCVPGQGYVRKYNQVGIPEDLSGTKLSGQDGKSPYGRYYVAETMADTDAPAALLSWPSPDDARRLGLDAESRAAVEAAWNSKSLPPQNTVAGGGVGLSGSDNPPEFTSGGFALTTAQMMEIVTALPAGAWVFIQP